METIKDFNEYEFDLQTLVGNKNAYCTQHGKRMRTNEFAKYTLAKYIEIDGKWLNDEEYGVVHRIASNGKEKGIAHLVFDWALNKCPNLRIDTHEVNIPMRTLLIKEGFKECGIITIADGTLRIAYHKVI